MNGKPNQYKEWRGEKQAGMQKNLKDKKRN
jgi:hypothetical protein